MRAADSPNTRGVCHNGHISDVAGIAAGSPKVQAYLYTARINGVSNAASGAQRQAAGPGRAGAAGRIGLLRLVCSSCGWKGEWQSRLELWDVCFDDLPDDLQIQPEIVVHDAVA
jgi:membrane protease subunit (stomatin/prohibitin family)